MWIYLSTTYLLTLIALSGAREHSSNDDLKLVTVLYRHGDRTPIDMYPNDPYLDRSNWPVGPGQLTARGKRMQFELGKFLRKRYDGFLNKTYDEREIYVRSTNKDRTLMSAQSNLAGLYPPIGDQVWNPELLWRPIPVHTLSLERDFLTTSSKCPKLSALIKDTLKNDPTFQALNEKYDWLYKYASKYAGKNISDPNEVGFLYDTLYIEKLYNKTLPEWTDKIFPDKMTELTYISFVVSVWTHEMKRLRSGPVIKQLIKNWVDKNEKEDERLRKFIMYSAHDTTISHLLFTLGIYNDIPPPYASTVIMELRHFKSSNKPYLQFFYRNDSSVDPHPLTLPGCDFQCPLDKFIHLTKDFIPHDWKEECNPDPIISIVTGFSGLIGVILITVFILSVILSCIRSRTNVSKSKTGYFSLNNNDNF